MRAVRSAPPSIEVVDVDEPEGTGVLVRIRAASICASDLTYIALGSTQVLGHELAGTLEDGTAVAVEDIFSCGQCEQCLAGSYNRCPTLTERVLGLSVDGGMSEWYRVPEHHVVVLPAGLDARDACLCEPAAVSWHALNSAGVSGASTVAIVGGGAIGLLEGASAQSLGAAEVVVETRHAFQREAAERLGMGEADGQYDVVYEAAGSESPCTARSNWRGPAAPSSSSACAVPTSSSRSWRRWGRSCPSCRPSASAGGVTVTTSRRSPECWRRGPTSRRRS
jgi:threonine dehydrogenase-like Zn-dependent dehydrogenase